MPEWLGVSDMSNVSHTLAKWKLSFQPSSSIHTCIQLPFPGDGSCVLPKCWKDCYVVPNLLVCVRCLIYSWLLQSVHKTLFLKKPELKKLGVSDMSNASHTLAKLKLFLQCYGNIGRTVFN